MFRSVYGAQQEVRELCAVQLDFGEQFIWAIFTGFMWIEIMKYCKELEM